MLYSLTTLYIYNLGNLHNNDYNTNYQYTTIGNKIRIINREMFKPYDLLNDLKCCTKYYFVLSKKRYHSQAKV